MELFIPLPRTKATREVTNFTNKKHKYNGILRQRFVTLSVFFTYKCYSTVTCNIITFKYKPMSKNLFLFLWRLGKGLRTVNTLPQETGTQKTGLAYILRVHYSTI